jgi:hypothetical protein
MALAIAHGDGALRFDWGIVVFGAALFACCLVAPATTGRAQSPPPDATSTMTPDPVSGLLPSYEINKIVRGSGFYPLALPQREGNVYVLRAIDRHDVLMRVVVDARSGAIRAVNRLVSVKAMGVVGTVPASNSAAGDSTMSVSPSNDVKSNSPQQEGTSGQPQFGPQFRDATPAHTVPADIGGSSIGAEERDLGALPPSMAPSAKNHAFQGALPLPRPRPSGLEKGKPAPKTHPVKSSAAAASVLSVAPRPAPATERKPPQTESH